MNEALLDSEYQQRPAALEDCLKSMKEALQSIRYQHHLTALENCFEKIKNASINQNMEMRKVDSDLIMLDAWKEAYLIAYQMDHTDENLLIEAIEACTSILISVYQVNIALATFFSPSFMENDTTFVIAMTILFLGAVCAFHAVEWIKANREELSALFLRHNRKNVSNVFEEVLIGNYKLQKPTGIHPDMLSPNITKYFERNRHIAIGFPGDFSKEKWHVKKLQFWNQWYTCSTEHAQALTDIYRLYHAYEMFHSGKAVNAFNYLKETFTDQYLQCISDSMMSQVLLILLPQLIDSTPEEKKGFYQLMGHCSRHDPDSAEFHRASFFTQFPDSETMPLNWEMDNQKDQQNIGLFDLEYNQRQHIVENLSSIFMPTKVTPYQDSEKKQLCFFPWNNKQDTILNNIDKRGLQLSQMKIM
ncbi:MAG: hypothetical protein P1U36_03010 [Legionellaceae bacterium]|nr:hypothetical protein [Legionellaceae bacterium]